ncbi:MAG: ADOP family duplicated permease [Gemmatimonadales bacterium]
MSVQRDVDAELRFHLEARVEELVEQGMARDEARAKALAEFGDVEDTRARLAEIDARVARRRSRIEWLEGVVQDTVYAARVLRRTPIVALTIVATLALGIGANAAMFSLLDVIFLRPPSGVANPATVRRIWIERHFSSGTQMWPGVDYASFDAVARVLDGKADVSFYAMELPQRRSLGAGEGASTATVEGVPANYFTVLGVKPRYGRFFAPDEDGLNVSAPLAVISDAFWKRELGGSPSVIGGRITLAQQPYTVIGVAGPSFAGTDVDATDVWLPIMTFLGERARGPVPWWQSSHVNGFQMLVRLHDDTPQAQLLARATTALRNPANTFIHDSTAAVAFGPINFARGPGERTAELRVAIRLGGVAAIVLLIACANVVNLLLARAVKRRREIAVRIALGVSRSRLVRLLVTESVLLALLAAIAAVAAAAWGGSLLRVLLMPDVHFAGSPLNWRVLGFALAAAAFVGVASGLVPALQAASPDVANALKAGARTGDGHRSRVRDGLVMMQAALSVLLLVGAVLFVRSLRNVEGYDMGYVIDGLFFGRPSYDLRDSARDAALGDRLRALAPRVSALPGVERVAFASTRPQYSFGLTRYTADGVSVGQRTPTGLNTTVSPNYFETVGMRLVRGRTFATTPPSAAPLEIIANQAMADSLWPQQDPIGRCVHLGDRTAPCATVVGVVQTALMLSFDQQVPQFFLSLDHPPPAWNRATDIVVRADPRSEAGLQRAVHDLLRGAFTGAAVRMTSMAQVIEPDYRPWKLGATLFTLFGMLALVVASVGIYSSVSYAVSQRTHEFGVRVALGARTSDILRQVLGEGLRTVALGIVLGILMALAAGRLVASLLYGVAASDPAAMATVALLLLVISALAALAPAWRAAGADPVGALRAD